MNEIVMWVSNLLSFFAIVVAAIVLIWQTDKQHKNNIKLTAIAKLQQELDAVKKLRQILIVYQQITRQVIEKIDNCLANKHNPKSIPVILQYCSNNYASLRSTISVIFGELRAEEAQIFCDFLGQAFAAESILAVLELDDGVEQCIATKLMTRKQLLSEFGGKFVELKCHADKAIEELENELTS